MPRQWVRKKKRGVSAHVLKVASDEVRQGKTVRSVTKDYAEQCLSSDTEQILQEIAEPHKVQESCPVWAITAVKKSLMHSKRRC